MKFLSIVAIGVVLAIGTAAPGWTACPGGVDTPPLCETGHMALHHANTANCFTVINLDTGDQFGFQYPVVQPPLNPLGLPGMEAYMSSHSAEMVDGQPHGGFYTIISNGLKTSCGDSNFYAVQAIRGAAY
jgi:hypothetical protein